jgi:hypothetical protein
VLGEARVPFEAMERDEDGADGDNPQQRWGRFRPGRHGPGGCRVRGGRSDGKSRAARIVDPASGTATVVAPPPELVLPDSQVRDDDRGTADRRLALHRDAGKGEPLRRGRQVGGEMHVGIARRIAGVRVGGNTVGREPERHRVERQGTIVVVVEAGDPVEADRVAGHRRTGNEGHGRVGTTGVRHDARGEDQQRHRGEDERGRQASAVHWALPDRMHGPQGRIASVRRPANTV